MKFLEVLRAILCLFGIGVCGSPDPSPEPPPVEPPPVPVPEPPDPEPEPEPEPEPGPVYERVRLDIRERSRKPNGVRTFHATPKVWREGKGWGPVLPENDPNRQAEEIRVMEGCPVWHHECVQDPKPYECPITFDQDVADEPFPANIGCPGNGQSPIAPHAFVVQPEGKGKIWATCRNGAVVSNVIEVDQ